MIRSCQGDCRCRSRPISSLLSLRSWKFSPSFSSRYLLFIIHLDFTSLSSLYDLHTNVLSLRLRTTRVVTSVVALRFPIGKRPLAAPKQHPPCNTSSLKHPLCAPLHPFLCLQPVYARHCRHRWRTMHRCKSACGKRASTNDQSTAVVVP